MSDTDDDMAAGAALYEDMLDSLQANIDKKVWVTRDGQRIKIKNMEDSHLLNAIRYIRSELGPNLNRWYFDEQLESLEQEAKKRGLQA